MKTPYVQPSERAWEVFFQQTGRGLPGYQGTQYQRGAGIGRLFGSLIRTFIPIAKSVGKTVGKQALKTGAAVAADAISGRNIGESFEEHGKAGAAKLLQKGVKKLDKKPAKRRKKQQKGRGLGYRSAPRQTRGAIKGAAKRKTVSRNKSIHRDQLGRYVV